MRRLNLAPWLVTFLLTQHTLAAVDQSHEAESHLNLPSLFVPLLALQPQNREAGAHRSEATSESQPARQTAVDTSRSGTMAALKDPTGHKDLPSLRERDLAVETQTAHGGNQPVTAASESQNRESSSANDEKSEKPMLITAIVMPLETALDQSLPASRLRGSNVGRDVQTVQSAQSNEGNAADKEKRISVLLVPVLPLEIDRAGSMKVIKNDENQSSTKSGQSRRLTHFPGRSGSCSPRVTTSPRS
jgi:hypothetical protein